MSEWYFTERGERKGPVSTSELKERAQSGSLTPDDLVWKEGMVDWAPASSIKGLVPAGDSAPLVKPARRGRDDDPDDDRPRKRRREQAADDDRPRSRRSYDDYDDDRPRRRRGSRDDDDERPRRRRPQPAASNVALWVSLGVAVFVVLVIFIVILAAAAHDDRKIVAVPPPRPVPIKIQPPAKPVQIPPVQPPPQPNLPPNPPPPQNIGPTPTDKAITLTAGKGTWNGNLDISDPFDPHALDCRCKVFLYPMKAGTAYTIDMTSVAIDSYLRIEDPSGNNVAEDDDSGGQLNARLVFIADRTGTYRIIATTFVPNTGAFQLRISP